MPGSEWVVSDWAAGGAELTVSTISLWCKVTVEEEVVSEWLLILVE